MKLKYLIQFTIISLVLSIEDIDRIEIIFLLIVLVLLVISTSRLCSRQPQSQQSLTVLSSVTIVETIILHIIFVSFIYVPLCIISFVNKTDDVRINEVKCFTFITIEILI